MAFEMYVDFMFASSEWLGELDGEARCHKNFRQNAL